MLNIRTGFLLTLAMITLAGCGRENSGASRTQAPATRGVTEARLLAAASDTANWMTHGRTWDEQRFVPLDGINSGNVSNLGLAWYFDIPTNRGIEATPLVIDGVMYVTGAWSIVYALDASTGEPLWVYDPQVPGIWAGYACCDVVNRGVAAWGDKIFVGTLDGYLVALDAASGELVWRVNTIDRGKPYTITGAPRVVKGKVIIGNGGAEFGVRGYVTAYDVDSGEQAWRFYTVPGNPEDGFEDSAMRMAAETWTGQWWQYGAGGTVWDSMAYDPQLDLLYIGVGNGSPWDRQIRSPEGGDNLFLSSVVALRPDSGEYVWHYQTTPGDSWDFTATQHMILADLEIDGETRKVLMQAPKNGYFYVLDRTNGEFISAKNYTTVDWATGINPDSGRPAEVADARYREGPRLTFPGPLGGHNWHPMSFNPETGLVYLSVQDLPLVYAPQEDFKFLPGQMNTGVDWQIGDFPEDPEAVKTVLSLLRGHLAAWDPVKQEEVWRYQHAGPWNGGTLSTAGNLVFHGNIVGEFGAYSADRGELLWSFPTQTGVAAGPVSYELNGEQYVSVAVGWGTILATLGGPGAAALGLENRSRVLTFRLGGTAALPAPAEAEQQPPVEPPELLASSETVTQGHRLYAFRCAVCHGLSAISGGVLPDLRRSSPQTFAEWDAIVLGGARAQQGMPAYNGILTPEESQAIMAYVVHRAHATLQPHTDD
jgi:PQQ-dependent dehydrogenase (methanol/ethanol family)